MALATMQIIIIKASGPSPASLNTLPILSHPHSDMAPSKKVKQAASTGTKRKQDEAPQQSKSLDQPLSWLDQSPRVLLLCQHLRLLLCLL